MRGRWRRKAWWWAGRWVSTMAMRWPCAPPPRSGSGYGSLRISPPPSATLHFGLCKEFLGRADGFAGLSAPTGSRNSPPGSITGLAYDAIEAEQIDVTDIYTTDAKIDHLDPHRLAGRPEASFPARRKCSCTASIVPTRFAETWEAIPPLQGRIDQPRHDHHECASRTAGRGLRRDCARLPGAGGARRLTAPARRGFWAKLFATRPVRGWRCAAPGAGGGLGGCCRAGRRSRSARWPARPAARSAPWCWP